MKQYKSINIGNCICYETTDQCPICKKAIAPIEKAHFKSSRKDKRYYLFECPACGEGFISSYDESLNSVIRGNQEYQVLDYKESFPNIPVKRTFDDNINKLSKNFCDIYNQANLAEQYKLNEIAGMGYRKALEFLIKDYCIHYHSKDAKKIKQENLSQVINEYITSDKIKNSSKASAWIGNDEAHYLRKYEDKDVKDLKKFIETTVAYIHYELTADEASEFINRND